jgi:hypothetical protein
MFEVILVMSVVALAFVTYCLGIQRGHREGAAMRWALEAENRRLRFGGSVQDPFHPIPDRLTGDRSARRIYSR